VLHAHMHSYIFLSQNFFRFCRICCSSLVYLFLSLSYISCFSLVHQVLMFLCDVLWTLIHCQSFFMSLTKRRNISMNSSFYAFYLHILVFFLNKIIDFLHLPLHLFTLFNYGTYKSNEIYNT
jgi:hypothetical protein